MIQLSELYPIQKELDNEFIQKMQIQGVNTTLKKLIALCVETGELGNEVPSVFKYWSQQCLPNSEKVASYYANHYSQPVHLMTENPRLEEFVDMLHFLLAIGLDLRIPYHTAFQPLNSGDLTSQFAYLFAEIGTLIKRVVLQHETHTAYIQVVNLYLGLGELLGYPEAVMKEAYMKKNYINHERIQAGY